MALIILDSSECALCGKILATGDAVMGLPPISAMDHYLYPYLDAGFHQACFDSWDKKEEIASLLKEEKEKFENSDYYKEMFLKYGKPGQQRKPLP